MIGMRALLCVLLTAVTLFVVTACGRVGPIRPPGPPEEIIYPRTYPSR